MISFLLYILFISVQDGAVRPGQDHEPLVQDGAVRPGQDHKPLVQDGAVRPGQDHKPLDLLVSVNE